MAKLVLVISKSGTGKSSSLRNFNENEASVVLCSGKELPFRNKLKTRVPKNTMEVISSINASTTPVVVIDDANYLMSFEEMERASETGYTKFTHMAQGMFRVFKSILDKDSQQIFYIFAHAEDREDGVLKFKTTGKMLSDKIVLEGLTNILITNEVADGEFVFRVKTDGYGVKTPMGMFEADTVPNDLKAVDAVIRDYYGMVSAPAPKPVEPIIGGVINKK